ncbi:MAG: DUF4389 domain-containing protein [Nitrosomonas sp.]|nr:DUF4389 domain-containing protein [Nitrosomonas sp.]
MDKQIKEMAQTFQKNKLVLRVFFMVFYIVIYSVSKFLIVGLALFQLVTILISEKPNEQVLKFSLGLSVYIYQIVQYVSFNSEIKPFPFSAWPNGRIDSTADQNPEVIEKSE